MKEIETKEINGYMHANIPLTSAQWLSLLQNPDTPKSYIDTLLKFYYEPRHEASCKQVSDKYGIQSSSINANVMHFGQYVQQLHGFSIIDDDKKKRFYLTIMDGKADGNFYSYKVKQELCEAIKKWLYIHLEQTYRNYRKEIPIKGEYNGSKWNELYKWELITACQNQETNQDVLGQSKLWKDTNLYYNVGDRKVVIDLLTNHADKYKSYLEKLCSEDTNLSKRLAEFRVNMKKIVDKSLTSKANDERIASTILTCHNPQKYTFYKNDIYEKLCKYLGIKHETRTSYKFPHFLELLQPLKEIVAKDGELKEIVTPYIHDLLQSNLLLAQDVCWCLFHMSQDFLDLPPKKGEKNSLGIDNSNSDNTMNIKYNKYIELLRSNKNIILTGAPGTGKTYLARHIAAAMIGCEPNELDKSGYFGFVQFHPSYDYTDFVEGLRPVQDKESDCQIGFERKNGVFKEFCEKALSTPKTEKFDKAYDKLVEAITDDENPLQLKTPKGFTFAISVNNKGNLSLHTGKDFKKNGVLTKEDLRSGAVYGKSPYKWWKGYYEGVIKELVDHYGLIIKDDNSLFQDKKEVEDKPYIFIIDEINRGEISKIFGELFFSIDPGYRGKEGAVRTQYANLQTTPNAFDAILNSDTYGHFFVPENVYIIGTMNDIDRSIESMDFAMRRRFAWEEVTADESIAMLNETNKQLEGVDQGTIHELRNRMQNLNNAIIGKYHKSSNVARSMRLGTAYQIGGSFFLKFGKYYTNGKVNAFDNLWNNHIKNVVSEYLRGNTNYNEQLTYLKSAYDDDTAHDNDDTENTENA